MYCNENIYNEKALIKKIEKLRGHSNGIIKIYDDFEDSVNHFIILEHGGEKLFDYISRNHKLIKSGDISLIEWQKHIKILFKQMVITINSIHKLNMAHLDISLENFLIKNVKVINGKFINHGIINLCDFGVAKEFNNNEYTKCTSYVGKLNYKSRECFIEKEYNAKLNDCWSLAVCLFIMIFGCMPYKEPTFKDNHYKNIIHGYLSRMISDNGIGNYSSKWFTNIINNILTLNHKRWNINILLNKI